MTTMRGVASALIACTVAACSGGSSTGPTAPTPPAALVVDIWSVTVNRWATSGAYDYSVTYRVHNTFNQSVVVSIAEAALIGPNGEPLGGHPPLGVAPQSVSPGIYSDYRSVDVWDEDVSHPFAEKLRFRMSYTQAGVASDAETVAPVLHGPQTGRLMDFSVSPQVPVVGQLMTVQWNVQSAQRVSLSWFLGEVGTPWAVQNDKVVEPVGSRTVPMGSEGRAWFTLDVDNGLINRRVTVPQ